MSFALNFKTSFSNLFEAAPLKIFVWKWFTVPTIQLRWAVVVAQLVEWSLLTPEVRSSNAIIGKIILKVYCQLFWKHETKDKRGRE